MPDYDWTVDDYVDLAEQLAHPDEYYYGVSNPIYEDFFPAMYNGGQGKYGWDGEAYHFDEVWANSLELKWELINNKVCEWMELRRKGRRAW